MVDTPSSAPARYRIGDLILDDGSRCVTRGQKTLKLGTLTFDLLLALVESAPNLASYDQLAERVWQGRSVTPETIAQRAKMLRQALSDDAHQPCYFEPVRGHGYRLIADVELLTTEEAQSRPQRRYLKSVSALLGLVFFLIIGSMMLKEDPPPSVAVLPFADMSELGDQQYFADGVADELINKLAGLDGLHVASRTSSFMFRDSKENLQILGDALGVASILEGSVRKSENNIRITVQLINVAEGYQIWSDVYDRELADIFMIQQEIASSVAGALGVQLGVGGVNEFRGAGTRNLEAYESYLQGSYERATQLDPNYAAAWARLGNKVGGTMWTNPPEAAPAIIDAVYRHVARAIELDPELAQAHSDFAMMEYARMNWFGAEDAFATALSLRKGRRILHDYANMLMRSGRTTAARSRYSEADALERLSTKPGERRFNIELSQGRFAKAREMAAQYGENALIQANIAIALNNGTLADLRAAIGALPPTDISVIALYAAVLPELDSPDQALATLRAVYSDSQTQWPSKYHDIALLAAYLGDPDLALQVFSAELRQISIRFGSLWYPVMSEVRQLAEFKKLVTDVNLVVYWRTHGWADACRPIGDDDFTCS